MTTYYVDTAVGNDGNAGTSEGAGNAWATIDNAMNTVAAGDKVWVKGNGTYAETPNIDTAGTNVSPIVFEGYTATTGDNGKVTMGGTTTHLTTSVANAYYVFKNFKFNSASSHGVNCSTMKFCFWYNCEFNSNGGAGADLNSNNFFLNCTANSNTDDGISSAGGDYFIGCIVQGNTVHQIDSNSSIKALYKCIFYGGTSGNDLIQSAGCEFMAGCTLDGENLVTHGIDCGSDVNANIMDSIIYDCGTGVGNASTPWAYTTFQGYNLLNSNTTDYEQTGPTIGFQDVTTAPAFTSESTDDYTLGGSSPAKNAGIQPGGIT